MLRGKRTSTEVSFGLAAGSWLQLQLGESVHPLMCDRELRGYNFANFRHSLALPQMVGQWSLTTLRDKLVKIGAKVIAHARCTVFQMGRGSDAAGVLDRIDRM